MFDITILAVGKIRENYYREALEEYRKRLSPYARVKIEDIKAEPFKRESDKSKTKRTEAERILKYLANHPDADIFILDERGRQYDSLTFAQLLKKQIRPMIFIIGGALGFEQSIDNLAVQKISLSPLTFPHELARVVLLEQLYRAVTIIKGKEYHY